VGPVAACIRCLPFPPSNPRAQVRSSVDSGAQVRRIEDLQCDAPTRESAREGEKERERVQ
jgi:hypothetical protein